MKVNLDGIRLLYERYWNQKIKVLPKDNALRLFTTDTELVSIKDALYCYGLCKMTVINETKDNKLYDRMKLTEFVEMIGRVADVKYKTQTMLGLAQKIEFVLDALLGVINVERQNVTDVVEEESESDDDY